MSYTKASVTFHYDHHRASPAVNVKCYKGIESVALPLEEFSPRFTHAWIVAHCSDKRIQDAYQDALEHGWDRLQEHAEDTFGENAKVYSQGRMGGWCVVDGLPAFDDWGPTDLHNWEQFEKDAKSEADDIPYLTCWYLYHGVCEPIEEREEEEAAALRQQLQGMADANIGAECI